MCKMFVGCVCTLIAGREYPLHNPIAQFACLVNVAAAVFFFLNTRSPRCGQVGKLASWQVGKLATPCKACKSVGGLPLGASVRIF